MAGGGKEGKENNEKLFFLFTVSQILAAIDEYGFAGHELVFH